MGVHNAYDMATPRAGKPQKQAEDLAVRRNGWPRFSIEVPVALLRKVDAEATRGDRSRAAEVRVLLAEAIEARRTQRDAP